MNELNPRDRLWAAGRRRRRPGDPSARTRSSCGARPVRRVVAPGTALAPQADPVRPRRARRLLGLERFLHHFAARGWRATRSTCETTTGRRRRPATLDVETYTEDVVAAMERLGPASSPWATGWAPCSPQGRRAGPVSAYVRWRRSCRETCGTPFDPTSCVTPPTPTDASCSAGTRCPRSSSASIATSPSRRASERPPPGPEAVRVRRARRQSWQASRWIVGRSRTCRSGHRRRPGPLRAGTGRGAAGGLARCGVRAVRCPLAHRLVLGEHGYLQVAETLRGFLERTGSEPGRRPARSGRLPDPSGLGILLPRPVRRTSMCRIRLEPRTPPSQGGDHRFESGMRYQFDTPGPIRPRIGLSRLPGRTWRAIRLGALAGC